jgi:tetratricopeptide (TPR) repeat protein
MMDKVDMTHETLKAYIDGDRDVIPDSQREESSRLQLLLDLVDQSISVSKVPSSSDASDRQFTFEQAEDILSDILAGTDSITIKQNFLAALYYSPDFYQRLMIKLNELVPVMEGVLDEELMEVAVKEDEQLLQQLGIGKSTEAQEDAKSKVDKILEKLFGWMRPVPRYVYAVAGSAVIFISAYFGVRFYNTTYQLVLAEDVLKENHRVYMADAPRLSGGYALTGIAQLMGDVEEETYLEKAKGHTKRAIASESTSPRIQELQAQIFIISNKLDSAEMMYRQLGEVKVISAELLNDQGVLKYNQGQYESAEQLFKQAIEADSKLSESYYNLALTQEKLGDVENAKNSIKQFLSIETDQGWQNAGQHFYKSLIDTIK